MVIPPQLGCDATIAKTADRRVWMDWFEQLTGFDPDASSGTFEAMLATVVGIAIIAVAAYVLSRRKAANTAR